MSDCASAFDLFSSNINTDEDDDDDDDDDKFFNHAQYLVVVGNGGFGRSLVPMHDCNSSLDDWFQSCPRVGWTRGSGRVGSGRVGSGRVGSGRVGSGRAGSGHDFAEFWRVGSGQHFGFCSFLLIISWYLNRYESSNIMHSD